MKAAYLRHIRMGNLIAISLKKISASTQHKLGGWQNTMGNKMFSCMQSRGPKYMVHATRTLLILDINITKVSLIMPESSFSVVVSIEFNSFFGGMTKYILHRKIFLRV
jgi:hypothetical protein